MEDVVKIVTRTIILLFLGLCVSFSLMAQNPVDLVGTWTGLGTLENMDGANELTLVLELVDGELSGHMTGEYGTLNQSPLKDIELSEGVFKFAVYAVGPDGQDLEIIFKMEIDEDTMTGEMEVPNWGVMGEWEAKKEK